MPKKLTELLQNLIGQIALIRNKEPIFAAHDKKTLRLPGIDTWLADRA